MNKIYYCISTPTATLSTSSYNEARKLAKENNSEIVTRFSKVTEEVHVWPLQEKIVKAHGTCSQANVQKYFEEHTNEDGEIILD